MILGTTRESTPGHHSGSPFYIHYFIIPIYIILLYLATYLQRIIIYHVFSMQTSKYALRYSKDFLDFITEI
jgi:hypothetical protein